MTQFHATNYAWRELISSVMDNGVAVKPRDQNTLELLNAVSEVAMSHPLLNVRGRKLNYRMACAEAAWILSGSNRLSEIEPFVKKMREFSDDGLTLAGAYGPKFVDQASYVVDCLVNDPYSRQAVMTYWRERPRATKDVPCTLTLQFLWRRDLLHLIVNMRSSDAWLGWPYDVFSFSMAAAWVAIALRQRWPSAASLGRYNLSTPALGKLWLNAGSQHLYERDWGKLDADGPDYWEPAFDYQPLDVSEFEHPEQLTEHLWALARFGQTPSARLPAFRRWLTELPHVREGLVEPPTEERP